MKLLFCCEQYWPSKGGVQEVIRQIAERLVRAGHEVAVATSVNKERTSDVLGGVRIHAFDVSGNLVTGLKGEVERYKKFVRSFEGDAILIKAAQQWSCDALWPILDDIKTRKVFVPCGFSSLYEPTFARYFAQMPDILRKFDHLIFYAESYRDIDFARSHEIKNFTVIPNGASEIDFGGGRTGKLRENLGIPADDFLFLTVGSPIQMKGHKEVGAAFAEMNVGSRNATLILNGHWPERSLLSVLRLFLRPQTVARGLVMLWRKGWHGVWERLFPKPSFVDAVASQATASDAQGSETRQGTKRVLCLDLPRSDVIDAFFEADLFVFASKVEYSPLVLFESAAAGTPFLTVPAGNAAEIVQWTGGGMLCPADSDERGYVNASPNVLASEMEKAMQSEYLLRQLGAAGRKSWQERFTWEKIARSYEKVLQGDVRPA
jgi:glycosyltransferase involved in cell wall biosynthesis